MLKHLRRLLVGTPKAATTPTRQVIERVPVKMHWRQDTRLPIPDWERIASVEDPAWDDVQRHTFWTSAAAHWLESAGRVLGPEYTVRESPDFLLLSALPERPAELFQGFCQTMLRRIRRNLGELAGGEGWGKYVAIVFDTEDRYYGYIAHYYPDGGEYAMSSGVFLQAGYGHFAMFEAGLDAMEPVIAHELTHCLLSHLPIPAWLNEGLAVNTEHRLFPHLADPRAQLYFPHEIVAKHAAYWNSESIQTFWSGKSFLHTDDGNILSYDLAAKITALAARDESAFRAFVAEASIGDAGSGAEDRLGYPISNLVEAVLGDGRWQPQPDTWEDGVEHGQFRREQSASNFPKPMKSGRGSTRAG